MACLTPRNLTHHRCLRSDLRITPQSTCNQRIDYFGNQLTFFTIQEPHSRLVVEAHIIEDQDDAAECSPLAVCRWPFQCRSANGQRQTANGTLNNKRPDKNAEKSNNGKQREEGDGTE